MAQSIEQLLLQHDITHGVVASGSMRRIRGIEHSIRSPKSNTGERNEKRMILDSEDPERIKPEIEDLNPAVVSRSKRDIVFDNLTTKEKTIVFAGDAVTLIHVGDIGENPYPLHRASRQVALSPSEIDPQNPIIDQQTDRFERVRGQEQSNMVAMCCNSHFWIEWRLGMSAKDENGIDVTSWMSIYVQFSPLDLDVVVEAFERPENVSVRSEEEFAVLMNSISAFMIGPRLPFADRLAKDYAQQALIVEDGLVRDASIEEVEQYVVLCHLWPSAILALESALSQPNESSIAAD